MTWAVSVTSLPHHGALSHVWPRAIDPTDLGMESLKAWTNINPPSKLALWVSPQWCRVSLMCSPFHLWHAIWQTARSKCIRNSVGTICLFCIQETHMETWLNASILIARNFHGIWQTYYFFSAKVLWTPCFSSGKDRLLMIWRGDYELPAWADGRVLCFRVLIGVLLCLLLLWWNIMTKQLGKKERAYLTYIVQDTVHWGKPRKELKEET